MVSPPSVGNAKARALKKKSDEEERQRVRRERAKEEERRISLLIASTMDDDGVSAEERRKSRRCLLRRTASSESNDDILDAVSDQLMGEGNDNRLTRRQRRKTVDGDGFEPTISSDNSQTGGHFVRDVVTTLTAPTLDEHEGMDESALKEHEEVTKVKNVATLELGQYQMDTWYFSPLPKEFLPGGMIDVLYVDEFSLKFFTTKKELQRYQKRELKRGRRHPPGNEIYRCGNLSSELNVVLRDSLVRHMLMHYFLPSLAVFEIDGFEQRIYCQNLCYIAKLFLDHKTLYYDVDPFLFYVLCEIDDRGK